MYTNADDLLRDLETKDEDFWIAEGEKMALRVFHEAAERVPAYKDFIRKHEITDHEKIKTIEDFKKYVPIMDKENYIKEYPKKELCLDGQLVRGAIFSYSSGTSGVPTLWPRFDLQQRDAEMFHEVLLRHFLDIDRTRSLFVVCFALGFHIAGMITVNAIERLLRNGHPLSMITPGKNKDDVVRVVRHLAPQYDQVIFFAHPGFCKEVIDELNKEDYDWVRHKTYIILSGGGFFESWRDYILDNIRCRGVKSHVIGLYGSTEIGPIAHETLESIKLRERSRNFFPDEPFIFQYIPSWRYIESEDKFLLFTVSAGVPLIRYSMGDRGEILTPRGINIQGKDAWKLPFVVLYGRPGVCVVNGANVYSEHIQNALEHSRCMEYCTGRFVMDVEYNDTFDERFVVRVEMKEGKERYLKELDSWFKEHLISVLLMYNKEYEDCVRALGEKVHPLVQFLSYGNDIFLKSNLEKKKL